MRKIKIYAIVFTILFIITFIFYTFFNFTNKDNALISFFNSMVGIFSTIAFGFWISFSFQYANEKINQKKENELIKKIREKEFYSLRITLSYLIRNFYAVEDQLLYKIKGIKSSFTKSEIDIENLTYNYFIFQYIYDHIDDYFNFRDKYIVKKNIDYLFMRDRDGEIFKKSNIKLSRMYEYFLAFNKECIRLEKTMEEYNINYRLMIFSENEIKAISNFAFEIGPGTFINFYPPYEIINMLKKILLIQNFIGADFIPPYKKEDFWFNIEKTKNVKNVYNNNINEWINYYQSKVKDFINNYNE